MEFAYDSVRTHLLVKVATATRYVLRFDRAIDILFSASDLYFTYPKRGVDSDNRRTDNSHHGCQKSNPQASRLLAQHAQLGRSKQIFWNLYQTVSRKDDKVL